MLESPLNGFSQLLFSVSFRPSVSLQIDVFEVLLPMIMVKLMIDTTSIANNTPKCFQDE